MVTSKRADRRTAFLLIAPTMLVLLVVNIYPFLYALYISAHTFTLGRPTPPRFIGLSNYSDLLDDDRFINSLWVSFKFVTIAVVVEFLLGFALAFLFNAKLGGLATLRKLAILPIMVMPLASGLVWFYILNENFGAMNWFAALLGATQRVRFLTGDSLAILSLVLADAWQWTPFVMLVMFAALQSIPEYVYEAAKMDGLNQWQTFWRVTLPLLSSAIWVVLVLRVVDAFRMVELIYLMTRGGPGGATETLSWYIYSTGFLDQDLGSAAAEAVVMIIVVTIVAQIFVRRLRYGEAT
ncbi:carbohydrate ABC transporter membrane protein 1, CUT1 family [Rhizobiales bacterium GAS191]|nr:carbohydrate ABC transporter membrane protein 1, CUT1 family [Rhizobiales bacterium GAS191]